MLTHDILKRLKELGDRVNMLERELQFIRRELGNKLDGTKYGGGSIDTEDSCHNSPTANPQDAFK